MTNKSKNNKGQYKKTREYQAKLKRLLRTSLYTPKSTELTKYRKSRINKLWREYGEELSDKNVLFVPFPKEASAQKLRQRAEAMQMKSSRKGVFIEKEGQRRGHMQFNKEFNEYEIILTGRTKRGKNKGNAIREQIPLARTDAVERELSKLKMQARNEKLKKGEYYRIKVTAPGGDGFSRMIYKDIDQALTYLKAMQKPLASRLQFYRYLSIEKVTSAEHLADKRAQREARKATRKRKVNKTGRNE